MKTIVCRHCGNNTDKHKRRCVHCGNTQVRFWLWSILLIGVLITFWVVLLPILVPQSEKITPLEKVPPLEKAYMPTVAEQVTAIIKQNAKDPDSIKDVKCSPTPNALRPQRS